jgi:small subunit ribosomal protein S5e
MAENDRAEVEKEEEGKEAKLFGRWSYSTVKVSDPTLEPYICINQNKVKVYLPHTAGRYQTRSFKKVLCPLVERFITPFMFHGRNCGKKMHTMKSVKQAFEIIYLTTGENPLQILVKAIENSGAREDSTRIGSGGVVKRQAVDVSPMRRVNVAITMLVQGAREAAFRKIKSLAECISDELVNAAKGSSNSAAVRKKDETERVAKGNR